MSSHSGEQSKEQGRAEHTLGHRDEGNQCTAQRSHVVLNPTTVAKANSTYATNMINVEVNTAWECSARIVSLFRQRAEFSHPMKR